jgi:Bacterial self-protective colicin-like immunity
VTEPPDLSSYVALLDQFVASDVTAEQFDLEYLRMFLGDHRMFGDPWYPVLNDLFYACEDYVIQPELRTKPGDLDEAQLLDAARTARARLAALGV